MINTKSSFLEKKKQQRKKTEDQIQLRGRLWMLQKNIRAFLCRRKIVNRCYQDGNIQCILLMESDISKFPVQSIEESVIKILSYPESKKSNYLKKMILSCFKTQNAKVLQLALKLSEDNIRTVWPLFESKAFANQLSRMVKKHQGFEFLNMSWPTFKKSKHVNLISPQILFESVSYQFQQHSMDGQGIFNTKLRMEVVLSIMDYLSTKNIQGLLTINDFMMLSTMLAKCLATVSSVLENQQMNGFIFTVYLLKYTLIKTFKGVTVGLLEKQKLKAILNLIEDEEELQYMENKLKTEPQFEDFSEITLEAIQKIFHEPKAIHCLMAQNTKFRQIFSSFISEINFIYDDRQILFVYHFLSDENSLKEMSKQKKIEFYSSLNMKVMTMDDQDFKAFNLFDQKEWREIIQVAIAKAFEITKKMLTLNSKKQKGNIKQRLFQRGDEIQMELHVLLQLLNSLNKKSLRTGKISLEYFINDDLDNFLNTFKFGVGARAIELMLKNFPFTFRFESRIKKLKQFIKMDKLNHDRSLFLQEQVDPDLIVAVRRGHEFLDAYDACFQKDLRRKYKIIFFNQQGMQEEGIDGGGIIKQFINRVLKSSFGESFGMFYETSQNQILPNPDSLMTKQYEFVGKIVGKAVYESINIDQKFAEPFLNLLIGRQNSFEDLQYIDKQIYKSMVDIRRMSKEDLESLQQTFTIMDFSPYGQKKIVNLKNLSNSQGKSHEVVVNSENKVEFVMAYSDYKCNKQLEEKTRLFRKGFLTVMKSQWLTMFSNQELNLIISGSSPNYSVLELKNSVIYNDYTQKSQTIVDLWSIVSQFSPEQKSAFLFYITSCSRPPTMGFAAMKPLICIQKSNQTTHLPTANTCMNVLRLPDYKNKQKLKQKLIYAINAKAGFQFA